MGVAARKGADMDTNQEQWLEKNAVTCSVFRGRWSVKHCLRIYGDIKDLRIRMATRAHGRVIHYQSSYNPCEHCQNLIRYLEQCPEDACSVAGHERECFGKVCAS
jgi:hypothetical protein